MICCHVQDAWQEWDWEEDLWDEGSEWDEYITEKETTSEGESGGDADGEIFFWACRRREYFNIYQHISNTNSVYYGTNRYS
jgi:hypothetical protein